MSKIAATKITHLQKQAIKHAAQLIKQADSILVGTGAGMGVDSGLATFRGKHKDQHLGVWPVMLKRGLDLPDMSPSYFTRTEEDELGPRFMWAFWKYRYDQYTNAPVHNGYKILKKWGEAKEKGIFSYTSNVDGVS